MPHAFVNKGQGASRDSKSHSQTSQKDTRKGLGYGIIEPRFHKDLEQSSNFPYLDDDIDISSEEVLDDEVLDVFLNKLMMKGPVTDPGSKSAVDPFYFAGGNTSLADCFFRPDDVLCEIEVVAKAMKVNRPFLRKRPERPKQKRGPNDQVGASFPSGGPGNFRPTGSKKGFVNPPPEIVSVNNSEEMETIDSAYRLEDILTPDEKAVNDALNDRKAIASKNKAPR